MKRRNKIILLSLISLLLRIVFYGGLIALFCLGYIEIGKQEKKLMIKYYSNDENYLTLRGTIEYFNEYGAIGCYNITDLNYKTVDSVYNGGFNIYSLDIKNTLKKMNPSKGMDMIFTCSKHINTPWAKSAIVEIFIDDNEILSYEDGKAALLKYINNIRYF